MIKEAYCSLETSKLLKEKGFDECPLFRYDDCGELWVQGGYDKTIKWHFPAPTLQMAMKWLREVHNIFIEIGVSIDLNGDYHFGYTILDKECKYVRRGYTFFDWSYEDAVEAALEYCLKILI